MNIINQQKVKLPSAAIILTIASFFGLIDLFFRPIFHPAIIVYKGFVLISTISLCVFLYKKNLANVNTAALFVLTIELIGHPIETLMEIPIMEMADSLSLWDIKASASMVSVLRYIFAVSSVVFCVLLIVATLMLRKTKCEQKSFKITLYLGMICCVGYSFFEFFTKGMPLVNNLFLVLWHIGNHVGILLTIFWLNNPHKAPANINVPKENDKIEELKQLKALLDSGAITQEEFDAKKKQILNL